MAGVTLGTLCVSEYLRSSKRLGDSPESQTLRSRVSFQVTVASWAQYRNADVMILTERKGGLRSRGERGGKTSLAFVGYCSCTWKSSMAPVDFVWWCVALLKRHLSIVRRPERTFHHLRAPCSHPDISREAIGLSHHPGHAAILGTPITSL